MQVREICEDELETLVVDCWLPFAEEMGELDEYNALAEHVRNGDLDGSITYREELFADEDQRTYVAVEAGELIGYATAERTETPPVFARGPAVNLGELFVGEAHRNDGIASALIERVERWAEAVDAERVTIAVNADNEPAKALYERHSYGIRRHKLDKTID